MRIGFLLANDLPYLLLAGTLVEHWHRGPEFDRIAAELTDINDFSTRELVLQFGNTSLVDFLLCLGGLIFRILSQVSIVGDCFLNPLNEPRSLDPNAIRQLIFKDRVTSSGHGELVHR